MSQDDILKLFNVRCNYSHTNCTNIQKKIMGFHKDGNKVDNNFLTIYLSYIFNSNYNYSYYRCSNSSGNWALALKEMCEYLTPTSANLILITCGNTNSIPIFKALVERDVEIDISVLKHTIINNYADAATFLLNYIVADTECLEVACTKQSNNEMIKRMLDSKLEITTTALNSAILNKKEDVVDIMLQYGTQPNNDSLLNACKTKYINLIRKILDYRIIPTKECYKALFENVSTHNNRYSYSNSTNNKQIAPCIDLLIVYGYKIDYDDVVSALDHYCYINDIKRFDIKFKPEFIEKCTEKNYFPYAGILDIKPSMKCLYLACEKVGNISNVKKLIDSGMKPDMECLRLACTNKTNKPIVQYLVEQHGLVPDKKCLKNNAYYLNNATLSYLLEKIPDYTVKQNAKPSDDETQENESSSTAEKIKKLKQQIKSLQNTLTELGIQEVEEAQALELEFQKSLEKNTKENEEIVDEEIVDEEIVDGETVDEETVDEVVEAQALPKKTYDIMKLIVPEGVPKSRRAKCKINNGVLKFFSLKNGSKLSFLEVRKLFVNYVKEKDLYDIDDKTYIKPNKEICKLLRIDKLEHGKYVNFNNFDDFVSQ